MQILFFFAFLVIFSDGFKGHGAVCGGATEGDATCKLALRVGRDLQPPISKNDWASRVPYGAYPQNGARIPQTSIWKTGGLLGLAHRLPAHTPLLVWACFNSCLSEDVNAEKHCLFIYFLHICLLF